MLLGTKENEQGHFCGELLFPNGWNCAKPTAQEGTTLPPTKLTDAAVRSVLGEQGGIFFFVILLCKAQAPTQLEGRFVQK